MFSYARADLQNQGISQVTKGDIWADFGPQPEQIIYSKHAANQSFKEGTIVLFTWQKNDTFLRKPNLTFRKEAKKKKNQNNHHSIFQRKIII